MSTRKERKQRKIEHAKRKSEHVTKFVTHSPQHVSLFDEVYAKMSGDVPVKCQGIYSSVFCKDRSEHNE